jgi:putative SOS response-associated peptidase YedK
MCFSVEIIRDLKTLSMKFEATPDKKAFSNLKLFEEKFPKIYKLPKEDNRIFPNYFSPVVIMQGGKKIIRPMRYRIRPFASSKEIPSKYNMFNARYDGLLKKKTWKGLFGKNHGIFPFKRFYEWVEDDIGKKKLVSFTPRGMDMMWAPCLYDHWKDSNGEYEFDSFALITDGPTPEIKNWGHDRCPIFLKFEKIEEWLDSSSHSTAQFLSILQCKEVAYFEGNNA